VKVLYLSQAGAIGGAERVLLDLIATVHKQQPSWQGLLIVPGSGGLIDEAQGLGIEHRVVPFPPSLASLGDADGSMSDGGAFIRRWRAVGRLGASTPAIIGYTRELARAIRAFQPDVIHANGFKMHLLGARAATADSAVLWHLHDYLRSRPLIRPLLRMHRKRCAMVVANSQSVADDAQPELGDALPMRTIYNGINLERFAPEGSMLDLDTLCGLGLSNGEIVRVGMLATAARWKGHEVFLRALSMLPTNLKVRAYVIGGPIYQTGGSQFTMAELHAMADNLGVRERVGFTGYLAEVPAVLRSLDIVVHASTKPEPFGLVVVEGMASGRAVIASAAGGVTELIEDGSNAMVHRPGDAQGLARAIERLVTDRDLRLRLGADGRRTAEGRFDRKRMGAEFASIYESLAVPRAGGVRAAPAHS